MADYKKKKIKRSFFHKRKSSHSDNKIFMNGKDDSSDSKKSTTRSPNEEIKVIKGSKIRRKRKTKILLGFVAFFLVVCFILSALLPGSLYENAVNFFAAMGQGGYPKSVSGGAIVNVSVNGSHYYVLSDTNITAYSSNGKIIFDELHGFSNPAISVAGTRALIFDQGGKNLYIYNLSGKLHTLNAKDEIITASISENGDYAVATHSDSYTSVVTVYDSDFESVYVWNSAKEIINNVLVDTDGEKLAISTFDVVSGQYKSKVMIFDCESESANALHTVEFSNSLVMKIDNTGDGISIITNDKYNYLDWSDFNSNTINFSGEIYSFQNHSDGVLLTINRANDRSDNTIIIVSEDGEKLSEFKIDKIITDIQYYDGRIYSLCDTVVNIIDKDGKILRSGTCNYGTRKIVVISSDSIASITDNEISKIDIE